MFDSNTEIKPGMKFVDSYGIAWTIERKVYGMSDGYACRTDSKDINGNECPSAIFILNRQSNTVS
jgi:hypothetical protein